MSKIPSPSGDYTPGNFALGKYIKDDLTSIVQKLNGNIDADNITDSSMTGSEIASWSVTANTISGWAVKESEAEWSVSVDGINAWMCGPDYSGQAGHRIIRCKKTFYWDGTSPDSFTLYFSQDGLDGYPYFSAPPTLMGAPVIETDLAADTLTATRVTAITRSFVMFECAYGGGTGEVTIHCVVAGPTYWY